ncbi:MAG: M3 family oligoendopeptidase [Lachnospiraceae bacterium]|nr:M3 family oligoendopeptidase [Lachnospiraceae bacterium]MDD7702091.1 M3 family oligoendopeptidase [Lachnospiraceae bacterium]MDY3302279.1 M3 family oligoendopeptidase [Lachnospiraceae bacterium]
MKFSEMNYLRPDLLKVENEFKELTQEMREATSGEAAFRVHEKFYALTGQIQTASELAMIRHDMNTVDAVYKEERDWFDKNMPLISNLSVEYQKALYESPYRKELVEKIGPVAFKNIELAMKSVDEKILPLMQEENELTTRYNNLLASCKIPFHGEECNLSLLSPYLHHRDRQVRKEAWEAYTSFFMEHEEELDWIYDRLVKNRTEQGRKMGHQNFSPLGYARMMRNSYGAEEIASFRRQVKKDFVPFVEELHERRRKRLGIDHLMYFDEGVYFNEGNPVPIGDDQQILASGRELYGQLSPETREFMDFMCENELFDVEGRKDKTTGGYMTYIPDYRSPFIFANFNGTSDDADVITHECGHAFQGYLTRNDPIREHADITMETAETHSMSMEFFTEPWIDRLFGSDASRYVEMHFEDAMMFIPYGTMVDEFQNIIYEDPSLDPKSRKTVWRDLEKQYKPHLDYGDNAYLNAGGFWQKQHHIYDLPFYYIDYCIAGTNALQYKVWMDQDYKAAWNSYLTLCKLSASDFFPGLMSAAGLRNPFEDGCLAYIVRELSAKL